MAEKICDQESELIESGGVPINQSELDKTALKMAILRSRNGDLVKSEKW